MKRAISAERETPKKRRRPRGPRTASPASRHRAIKPLSINEAKASSEKFQKALQKSHTMESGRESSPAAHAAAALEPAAPLVETPTPAASPRENLESVVQKIPASSVLADMDTSDDGRALEPGPGGKEGATVAGATPEESEDTEKEPLAKVDELDSEEIADMDEETQTQAKDAKSEAAKVPEPTADHDNVKANDIKVIASPQQGAGASPDDSIELDPPTPSRQLEHEHELSKDTTASSADTPDQTPGTIVTSQWLLAKLDSLSADTLEAGRAAIRRELQDMATSVARLPRAELTTGTPASAQRSPTAGRSSSSAAQRLALVETLIGLQLAAMPGAAWRGYKAKLVQMCARSETHNMDFRQRLAKVKEIVFLPEELILLRDGNVDRMRCAVRVCATVTEILGPEDEVVPEEMGAWLDMQLEDVAWKAKLGGAWRKYWSDAAEEEVESD